MQRRGESPPADEPLRGARPPAAGRRVRGLGRRDRQGQQETAAPPEAARVSGEGPGRPVEPGQHVLHELGAAVPSQHPDAHRVGFLFSLGYTYVKGTWLDKLTFMLMNGEFIIELMAFCVQG